MIDGSAELLAGDLERRSIDEVLGKDPVDLHRHHGGRDFGNDELVHALADDDAAAEHRHDTEGNDRVSFVIQARGLEVQRGERRVAPARTTESAVRPDRGWATHLHSITPSSVTTRETGRSMRPCGTSSTTCAAKQTPIFDTCGRVRFRKRS